MDSLTAFHEAQRPLLSGTASDDPDFEEVCQAKDRAFATLPALADAVEGESDHAFEGAEYCPVGRLGEAEGRDAWNANRRAGTITRDIGSPLARP